MLRGIVMVGFLPPRRGYGWIIEHFPPQHAPDSCQLGPENAPIEESLSSRREYVAYRRTAWNCRPALNQPKMQW